MIILIDDDKLIHIGWKLKASKKSISFTSFFSIEEFMIAASTVDKKAIIYIDSHLKDGIRGEFEAEKIYSLGFKNINLTTGYDEEDFNLDQFPWLIKVVSKNPPF